MFNNPISTYFIKTIIFYVDPRVINSATFVSALPKYTNPIISMLLLYLQMCWAQRHGYVPMRPGTLLRLGVLCATFILWIWWTIIHPIRCLHMHKANAFLMVFKLHLRRLTVKTVILFQGVSPTYRPRWICSKQATGITNIILSWPRNPSQWPLPPLQEARFDSGCQCPVLKVCDTGECDNGGSFLALCVCVCRVWASVCELHWLQPTNALPWQRPLLMCRKPSGSSAQRHEGQLGLETAPGCSWGKTKDMKLLSTFAG